METHVLAGARIFDGRTLREGQVLVIEGDRIAAILPEAETPPPSQRLAGIIAPGFVDLQVNGGGGRMVDGQTDLAALRTVCDTHRARGCAAVLPTLITDTQDATARVIAAGIEAAGAGLPGFLGLHLEGPHLDPRRKGAHDPALIRPMGAEDLDRLCAAARALPVLMVTLAPEAASPQQIAALAGAGAIVSLGHSDCDFQAANTCFGAGARTATHLFNAMSQLGHRSPGLAGAVLAGGARAGIIADGHHVHPAALRIALAARPDGLFLVSDCMAFAGTDLGQMRLNGREILRRDGRLTLADGTLAGADLRLDQGMGVLVREAGATAARALAMATSEPAAAVGMDYTLGHIAPGRRADLIHLADDLTLSRIWRDGTWHQPLAG